MFLTGGNIMKARKETNVQYPNLYGNPGLHKEADTFNRVQRGAQNPLETLWFFVPAALISGLKYPIAVAVEGACFSLGIYLYQAGYSDEKQDANKARHLKGGPIKYIGTLGVLGQVVMVAGSLNGWW
jgi:glutathione S-transferase